MHAPPRANVRLLLEGFPELGPRGPRKTKNADEVRMIATEVLRNPHRKP